VEQSFEKYNFLKGLREISGRGIGLAFCRTVITKHQGRMCARNTEFAPPFHKSITRDTRFNGTLRCSH
jgi:K+-sensing histidine kinase KdpD